MHCFVKVTSYFQPIFFNDGWIHKQSNRKINYYNIHIIHQPFCRSVCLYFYLPYNSNICSFCLDGCEMQFWDWNEAGGCWPYEPLPHLCSNCHGYGGRAFPGSFWQLGWHVWLLVSNWFQLKVKQSINWMNLHLN